MAPAEAAAAAPVGPRDSAHVRLLLRFLRFRQVDLARARREVEGTRATLEARLRDSTARVADIDRELADIELELTAAGQRE